MRHTLLPALLLCLACAGCAELNNVALKVGRTQWLWDGLLTDRTEQSARLQRQIEERKASIEQRAANKEITWFQAAREVRNLERRSNWVFEKADEEYHAYSAAVAEQVDAGRLTFAEYDALRTQRFNEIHRRRARH